MELIFTFKAGFNILVVAIPRLGVNDCLAFRDSEAQYRQNEGNGCEDNGLR